MRKLTVLGVMFGVGWLIYKFTFIALLNNGSPPSQDTAYGAMIIAALVSVPLWGLLLPSVIAFANHHPNRWPILIDNFTSVTWRSYFETLMWASKKLHDSEDSQGGESGINIFEGDAKHIASGLASDVTGGLNTTSISNELKGLRELRDDGTITKEEFEAAKAKILES